MKAKTVLFTGASRGMGRFAAFELARLDAQILIVGHNEARGDAAAGEIRSTGVVRTRGRSGRHTGRRTIGRCLSTSPGSCPQSQLPVTLHRPASWDGPLASVGRAVTCARYVIARVAAPRGSRRSP
jgi:NAD(P)-dependent dehydrogenase (short-subunit alcohol dehydrogenase family)